MWMRNEQDALGAAPYKFIALHAINCNSLHHANRTYEKADALFSASAMLYRRSLLILALTSSLRLLLTLY